MILEMILKIEMIIFRVFYIWKFEVCESVLNVHAQGWEWLRVKPPRPQCPICFVNSTAVHKHSIFFLKNSRAF